MNTIPTADNIFIRIALLNTLKTDGEVNARYFLNSGASLGERIMDVFEKNLSAAEFKNMRK